MRNGNSAATAKVEVFGETMGLEMAFLEAGPALAYPTLGGGAAELALVPDSFHRDPADRILVATARVLGAALLTRDGRVAEAELG